MSLAAVLSSCRRRGRAAFVPYLTAGDPDLGATGRFLRALKRAGADIVELGVPFSDPVADGPTIQAASERALASKTTLARVLALARAERRRGPKTPLILFTYLNPILRYGVARFARAAGDAGVAGVLIVDLPAEESAEVGRQLRRFGVEPVMLASPTTSDARLRAVGRASGSIVYYVSREGVTGARRGLAPGLAARLSRVRRLTGKPLIVGFGIATPAQARGLARAADGVVVGSALVGLAGRLGPRAAGRAIARLAGRIARALSDGKGG